MVWACVFWCFWFPLVLLLLCFRLELWISCSVWFCGFLVICGFLWFSLRVRLLGGFDFVALIVIFGGLEGEFAGLVWCGNLCFWCFGVFVCLILFFSVWLDCGFFL